MYNSQNLPLEFRKVIKKSLGTIIASLLISIFASVMLWIVLISLNENGSNLLFAILGFVVVNLLLGGSAVLYQYLYYRFYYYNFEDDKAEIKKGVIAIATGHVRYERIQNIYIDQDIMDRIFGLYDVHYETAGESSGFYSHVDGLNKINANKLVEFLNAKVQGGGSPALKEQIMQQEKSIGVDLNIPDVLSMSRDSLPIDKRLIFVNFVSMSLIYSVAFLFVAGRIFVELSAEFSKNAVPFLLVPIVLIFLFSYIYVKIWYNNFYFKFDSNGGTISEKVIATSEKHLYYDRIQNINISQGVIDRVFGLNKLVIETAAEGSKIKALFIPGLKKGNAELLRDFLLEKSKKYRSV